MQQRAVPPNGRVPATLNDRGDIRILRRSGVLYSNIPVLVRVRSLSRQEAEPLRARVQRDRQECGCSLGAAAMIVAFAATACLLAPHVALTPASVVLRILPLSLLAAFAGAGAGKATGILLARRRLRRDIGQLAGASARSTEEPFDVLV